MSKKSDRKANRFNCGRMSSILMYKSDGGETMLLLNKTLLRLARGLWQWILAIAAVSFLTLVGTTALAEIVSQFLGSLFEPQVVLSTVKSAVGAAFLASVFTFLAQLVKGLIEYKTAAKARSTMRKKIFSKVMELDAGGIEKIGPTSAITAAVDAVEQMQTYFSTYLPPFPSATHFLTVSFCWSVKFIFYSIGSDINITRRVTVLPCARTSSLNLSRLRFCPFISARISRAPASDINVIEISA